MSLQLFDALPAHIEAALRSDVKRSGAQGYAPEPAEVRGRDGMTVPPRTVTPQVPRRLARRRAAVRAHVRGLAGPIPTDLPARRLPGRAGTAALADSLAPGTPGGGRTTP